MINYWHCFQDSMTDPATWWYIQSDNAHIHVWKDSADTFLKQNKHNIDDSRSLRLATDREEEFIKLQRVCSTMER